MDLIVISYKEAKSQGLKYYFTGKPCGRGHLSKRSVSSRNCWDCNLFLARGNANKLAYMAEYSAANRDRENARAREWYANNKERHQGLCRKYQEENKAAVLEMSRAWREANKDKVLIYSRARKSRVRAAEGTWSFKDVELLLRKQSGLCVYCSIQLDNNYHVDHIMPLYLGGSNWPSNLQLLCQSCNLRKSRKHPDDFEREIGFIR